MLVSELINELKKYPQDSHIGFQSHDTDEDKIVGIITSVDQFFPHRSFDPIYCENVYVVLR